MNSINIEMSLTRKNNSTKSEFSVSMLKERCFDGPMHHESGK